jgi:hypothetical protein
MRTRPRPNPSPRSAFAGFRFPPDVIVVAVRWYLRFGLSYRDLEELLAERGVEVDHVTVYHYLDTAPGGACDPGPASEREHLAQTGIRGSARRPPRWPLNQAHGGALLGGQMATAWATASKDQRGANLEPGRCRRAAPRRPADGTRSPAPAARRLRHRHYRILTHQHVHRSDELKGFRSDS